MQRSMYVLVVAYMQVVSSAIVDKYIGESARLIREMFGYAREHQPCVIFMDEIDAIGGRRFSEGTSADREIQRTLMELLSQLDGFDTLGKVKMIMATNRPDVLDPALLRPGRLDRKVEIPLPNEMARMEILKIHASNITKHGEIDYEAVVKLVRALLDCCIYTTLVWHASMACGFIGGRNGATLFLTGGKLQRRGFAQYLHGGGHVCDSGRA